MVPDGDRRQGAQSGRIEIEPASGAVWDEDVVCVFVLRHDDRGYDRWSEPSSPLEQVAQRA